MAETPGAAVVFVVASSLRGAGDTRTPLLIGGVIGAIHLASMYVLISGHLGFPALGVSGAALASPLAFTIGAALGLVLLARGGLPLQVRWSPMHLDGDLVRRILRVGWPAALEHLLMQIGFFLYVIFVAAYGTGPAAAYFIGARVLGLSFLPGLGFGVAAGALVGQHLGAGQSGAGRAQRVDGTGDGARLDVGRLACCCSWRRAPSRGSSSTTRRSSRTRWTSSGCSRCASR